MPKTETVFEVLDRLGWYEEIAIIRDADDPAQDEAQRVLDYPIVRCGDSKVVLAVDREELEADVTDGVEVHFDEVGNITHVTYDAHAIVDAIIAKLAFREVEWDTGAKRGTKDALIGRIEQDLGDTLLVLPDGSSVALTPGLEVALLKPSPTSKEGE